MTRGNRFSILMLSFLVVCLIDGARTVSAWSAEPALAEYFRVETARIEARPLAGISSADAWKAHRLGLQRQAMEMLGLWPTPPRTDLHATVTGTVEQPDFLIEKLHFQSRPGLYVTANLYRPKAAQGRLPAVLYVCGHAKVEKDGVIYGCKAHYQHHAAWYAANGFICLVVDTLQLGEVPGLHHGTYRENEWWWHSRGYTPAGVEAWNGVRAIDYLCSRPDVDPAKIGVTGRSGGGATSWWLGAIDDRLAAVAPVAGITDLRDHVVDGVVQGHCDCMYFVNTYRWNYDTLAALVAPKPLLVENTDKDPIFPLDGVKRIYSTLERVYGYYGASDRLGLVVTPGGHVDTPEIRHPSFTFMRKWLQGKSAEAAVDEPDRSVAIEKLRVLPVGAPPADALNGRIQRSFVSTAEIADPPASPEAWAVLRAAWLDQLRTRVFGGWPQVGEAPALGPREIVNLNHNGVQLRGIGFLSQQGVPLTMYWLTDPGAKKQESITLLVLDDHDAEDPGGWTRVLGGTMPSLEFSAAPKLARWRADLALGRSLAVLVPRGVAGFELGGLFSPIPAKELTHVRRRFALLGQTLDGMRVWDARRAVQVLMSLAGENRVPIRLAGRGAAAAVALLAGVFEPDVIAVELDAPPPSLSDSPTFLNFNQVLELPQAIALMAPRQVVLRNLSPPESWAWLERFTQTGGNGWHLDVLYP